MSDEDLRAFEKFAAGETPTAVFPPPGDYCIAELFGHTTLVGRYTEVEMFGTKMLAIEPLFNGTMLPVVFHGGAAIYRLTPCSAEVAFKEMPTRAYELPPQIRAIVPAILLPAEKKWGASDGMEDGDGVPF